MFCVGGLLRRTHEESKDAHPRLCEEPVQTTQDYKELSESVLDLSQNVLTSQWDLNENVLDTQFEKAFEKELLAPVRATSEPAEPQIFVAGSSRFEGRD